MRIAALLYEFPSVSQTFVLNQLVGLIERGQRVEIFAAQRGDEAVMHPEVAQHHLLEHTTYYSLPKNYLARLANAVPLVWRSWRDSPLRAVAAMNVPRYGIQAASLQLLYEMDALRGHAPFDVVH